MSAMQIVVAAFAVVLAAVCGWIFGYMTGQRDFMREQNDMAYKKGQQNG